MSEPSVTIESFLASSLKPVLSTRTYLLNKPCSRCHRGTNIRVNKPTCSHRICATCLASFEVLSGEGGRTNCPICSTYWFTLRSERCDIDENMPSDAESLLRIEKRSKEIEQRIYGNKNLWESTQSNYMIPPEFEGPHRQPTTSSDPGIQLRPTGTSFPTHDVSNMDPEDIGAEQSSNEFDRLELRVKEQWRMFCEGLNETEANLLVPLDTLERPRPQLKIKSDNPTEKGAPFELEGTESRPNSSSTAGIASREETEEPGIPARELGYQVPFIPPSPHSEPIENVLWPALFLISIYLAFELAAVVVMPSILAFWR
ncbi:hypothetical protein BU23DRAFT_641575 [Bimuria novae-zelandiae CBS 107.79]|uniref:RING-type domain-containing protein n=1 Tax=Bimuria novae-zelandiae CBS 107.79 TaxID=1447943 RepID=A0A6A5V7J5_9PLEO|nr:hypothetical protein BU23DRAFT_641575 [Bimuria novae-zelandiae CBS 107.79]